MIGRFARLLGMTSLLLTVFAIPAHADGELGVSRDGVHWADSLSEPLFDSDFRWVPGDAQTTTFWVRNQAATGAELTVDVRADGDLELLGPGDMTIEARAGNDAWLPLENGTLSAGRLNDAIITAGTSSPVDVRIALKPESINQSQLRSLRLSFAATLSQSMRDADDAPAALDEPGHGVTVADGPRAVDSYNRAGVLPNTGAPEFMWIAISGSLLIGIGLALLVGRRRNDEKSANV